MIPVACLSGVNTAEGVVNVVFWRTNIEELNKGKLVGDAAHGDKRLLHEAGEGDNSGDPSSTTKVRKVRSGDKESATIREF